MPFKVHDRVQFFDSIENKVLAGIIRYIYRDKKCWIDIEPRPSEHRMSMWNFNIVDEKDIFYDLTE